MIVNGASITFTAGPTAFTAASNLITTEVTNVASMLVEPKESGGSAPSEAFVSGPSVTRHFTIANTGNVAAKYVVQSVATTAGSIVGVAYIDPSGATIPITPGKTVSPTVNPGQIETVQVTLSTQGLAVGTQIVVTLAASVVATAGTAAESDTGTVVGIIAAGITWGAPGGNATSIPTAFVNGVSSAQVGLGGIVTYTLGFENYGGIAATNVQILDNVPVGITPNTAGVTINGVAAAGVRLTSQTLNAQGNVGSSLASNGVRQTFGGQVLVIPVGTVAPLTPLTIVFTGLVNSGDILGTTYVNNATLQAANIAPLVFPPTSVFLGAATTVYDGTIGSSKSISGAQISIVNVSGQPIALTGTAVAPNLQNANPFTTSIGGQYGFGFGTGQYGLNGAKITYEILISATGYLNRKVQAVLTPDASGFYYSVTLTALDGQALASAGAYGLTNSTVTLSDVYGMLGNFPLFTPNIVTVSLAADRSVASGGNRVVFTLTFAGNATTTLGKTEIVDTLPPGLVYAPGTGRLDGTPVEPARNGRVLTWTLPNLSVSHVILYATVVLPTVAEGATLFNNATVSAVLPFDPSNVASAAATCEVEITAGLFSERIIITGRVFADVKGTGRFTRGDLGVAGVRIFLEDGESVATDQFGRFTFPAARPGMHVMRLDIATLPKTVQAYPDKRYDSERSVRRLVHGIFDAGLMEDVNFALLPVSK